MTGQSHATPVGELLVRRGVVDAGDLEALVTAAAANRTRLLSQCLDWGLAEERVLADALAEQRGHPCLILSESVLDLKALALVPRVVADQHRLLPVAVDEETLTLAAADIGPRDIFDQVAFASGRRVVPLLGLDGPLGEAIGAAYEALSRREPALAGALVDEGEAATPSLALARAETEPASEPDLTDLVELVELASVPELAAGPSGDGRPLVLVVDDEDDLRGLLHRMLRHDGYRVAEARTGREALALLRVEHPAVVLLDAMLPEVHGFEICRAIKRSPALAHLPVVMISAVYKGYENAREIQEVHGADAFVEKPFDVPYVRELVARMLGRRTPRPVLDEERMGRVLRARNAATVSYRMGELDDAETAAGEWHDLDPFDPQAHLLLGNVRTRRGDPEGAMRAYERAATFGPELFAAFKNLALTYEQLGFQNRAFLSWTRAAELAGEGETRARIQRHLREHYPA